MSVFFSGFMGKESELGTNKSREPQIARNKQIAREPFRCSRDSFPMNPEKKKTLIPQ